MYAVNVDEHPDGLRRQSLYYERQAARDRLAKILRAARRSDLHVHTQLGCKHPNGHTYYLVPLVEGQAYMVTLDKHRS